MTQNKLKFGTLMGNEECAREVRELLKESKSTGGRGKVWMVVGFLTTGETRWFVEKREGKAVGGRVGVPLSGHVLPNIVSAPSSLPGAQELEPPSSQASTNPEPPISPPPASNTSLSSRHARYLLPPHERHDRHHPWGSHLCDNVRRREGQVWLR